MRRNISCSACLTLALVAPIGGLAAESQGSYRVVHGWPHLPEGFSFGQVPGLDVDSHNHVWVFHRGTRPIMTFEGTTGELRASFGDGMFLRPHGLRVDGQDNVWVTDKDHNQIHKFSHDGRLLMTIGEKGVAGQDGKHFDGVADLAFTSAGDFYVADGYQNNRIAKFSKDGKFLFEWGSKGNQPGQFNVPHSVAVDAKGRVYVADRSNFRVQVFDGEGRFLRQWKGPEIGCPWGVTIGPDGFLYMVDGGDAFLTQNRLDPNPTRNDRARVLKMDLEGNIIEKFGSYGHYDGQFIWPHDLAVGKDGAVYVGDVHTGMRVQKFIKR